MVANRQIEFEGLPCFSVHFTQNIQSQNFGVEFFGNLIIGADNGDVVDLHYFKFKKSTEPLSFRRNLIQKLSLLSSKIRRDSFGMTNGIVLFLR